ncbi:MAG: type 2 isopentenyl-diphosphate Delta-isomerase, partial [Candidatus Bathyarchaeia archaeon]
MLRGIENRKSGHLEISLREFVESNVSPGFEDVFLVHNALPEISKADVDTSVRIFGHKLKAPLILESMTGGVSESLKINKLLAECAQEYGLAIGVGSQRAALENPDLVKTYTVVRDSAPDAMVFANLGCPQFAAGYGVEEARACVEMVKADALMIHTNPLQESVQPEGEPSFERVLSKIEEVASALEVPVIVKETGSGISGEVSIQIEKAGAKGVDVAGAGGTSWAAVEYCRAVRARSRLHQSLGKTFRDWGIPTCASIVETSRSTKLTVISSGGVRSGVDIAKSIALGADAGGAALPFLKSAKRGRRFLNQAVQTFIEELRTSMFLVGARNVDELSKAPVVITGR